MPTFAGAVYANGACPAALLAPVDSSRFLRLDAYDAWRRVVAEVKARYGWTPQLSDGATAYRSLAQQEQVFRLHYTTNRLLWDGAHTAIWQGRTWYRRKGYPSAAVPGTSNHGVGLAVDVAGLGAFGSTRQQQFMAVAAPNGFTETEGRRIDEGWHKVYDPPRDTHPAPTAQEEDKTPEQAAMLAELHTAVVKRGYLDAKVSEVLGVARATGADVDAIRARTDPYLDAKVSEVLAEARKAAAAGGSAGADLAPVLAAIQALPAQTIEALKAALA